MKNLTLPILVWNFCFYQTQLYLNSSKWFQQIPRVVFMGIIHFCDIIACLYSTTMLLHCDFIEQYSCVYFTHKHVLIPSTNQTRPDHPILLMPPLLEAAHTLRTRTKHRTHTIPDNSTTRSINWLFLALAGDWLISKAINHLLSVLIRRCLSCALNQVLIHNTP